MCAAAASSVSSLEAWARRVARVVRPPLRAASLFLRRQFLWIMALLLDLANIEPPIYDIEFLVLTFLSLFLLLQCYLGGVYVRLIAPTDLCHLSYFSCV